MEQLKVKTSWLKRIELLSDAECGRLFRGMLQYASSGETPSLTGSERIVWAVAMEEIDKQQVISRRRADAGHTGGSKPKQTKANESKTKQTEANDNTEKALPSSPPAPPVNTPVKEKKETLSKEREKKKAESPLDDALSAFKDMRNRMHKPMTQLAVDLLVQKLEKLAPGDTDKQVAMLMQSIENGWSGVYELKQEQKPRMSAKQKDYYDKWHPACERGGYSGAKIEEIELHMEDLD